MSPEGKRALIAILRRVALAGLVLLSVWLILIALRKAIPASVVDLMNTNAGGPLVSHDSGSWDWSSSLWRGQPVSQLIGQRLGLTLQLIGLCALFSLALAAILLSLGALVRRATERPGWLSRLRSIVRLVLVSGGVSIPAFAVGTFSLVFLFITSAWSFSAGSPALIYWKAFLSSILPAWLLVQACHGEMANWNQNTSSLSLAKHLPIRLVIRLFRLIGVIIVVTSSAGLGSLLMYSVSNRDFPVIFGIAWIFVVMVILVKLAAEIIEIVHNRLIQPIPVPELDRQQASLQFAVPRGWLIFSLGLIGISILVAALGPLLAPYGPNEIALADSLAAPSAGHLLGTDNMGRDVLSRALYGIRIDVLAGLVCAGIVSVLATGWAMLAAHFRSKDSLMGSILERLVMLPRNILLAFPWLVLLLLIISIVVLDYGIVPVVLITSLVILPHATTMIQEALQSRPKGMGSLQSLRRTIPIIFIFTVAGGILYVSTLSYLGFGVSPPDPELGSMLSGAGIHYMLEAPWVAWWPFTCLALLLLTWVMAGDALLERLGFHSKAVWSKVME